MLPLTVTSNWLPPKGGEALWNKAFWCSRAYDKYVLMQVMNEEILNTSPNVYIHTRFPQKHDSPDLAHNPSFLLKLHVGSNSTNAPGHKEKSEAWG